MGSSQCMQQHALRAGDRCHSGWGDMWLFHAVRATKPITLACLYGSLFAQTSLRLIQCMMTYY